MRLYSGPLSLFTGEVRIALDEKEIEYELVSAPFRRAKGYEPKRPVRLNRKKQAMERSDRRRAAARDVRERVGAPDAVRQVRACRLDGRRCGR
jgi:hypothetical protein